MPYTVDFISFEICRQLCRPFKAGISQKKINYANSHMHIPYTVDFISFEIC